MWSFKQTEETSDLAQAGKSLWIQVLAELGAIRHNDHTTACGHYILHRAQCVPCDTVQVNRFGGFSVEINAKGANT